MTIIRLIIIQAPFLFFKGDSIRTRDRRRKMRKRLNGTRLFFDQRQVADIAEITQGKHSKTVSTNTWWSKEPGQWLG